jgi:hypothetical protein
MGLYRGVERKTLDLPLVSIMPMLICGWAILRFYFFFIVGLFLIAPVNLIIFIRNRSFIRNRFPGHWGYRPFFLHHLYYVWLWVWRGEAPTTPLIFVRPLLTIFMKLHFERRLRRLRLEILLGDELSDATRSTLLARLDAALERWRPPRFAVIFTVLLPAITSVLSSYKQLTELLGSFEIQIPVGVITKFVSEYMPFTSVQELGSVSLTYLFGILITAFLAKRGLFLGADASRICFPGGQGDRGVYSKEKEILGTVGLHGREAPIDLWLLGITVPLGLPMMLLNLKQMKEMPHDAMNDDAWAQFVQHAVQGAWWGYIIQSAVLVGLVFIAAFFRRRIGRT